VSHEESEGTRVKWKKRREGQRERWRGGPQQKRTQKEGLESQHGRGLMRGRGGRIREPYIAGESGG